MLRSSILSVLLCVAGCDEASPIDAGPSDAGVDATTAPRCEGAGLDAGSSAGGITRGCAQGVIASGFGIRYGGAAQPLSRWGAWLRPEAPEICGAGTVLSGVTLVTEVDRRVGEAVARTTYHVLGEGDVVPSPDAGTGTAVRVERGRVTLEPSAETPLATGPALFDLAAVGLDTAPFVAVVLDGFEIETDVPQLPAYPSDYDAADGYAVRAIAASLADVVRDGTDLRFDVAFRLELGRSGDPAMDRAAAVARTRVTVRYAVIGLPAAPVTGSVAYVSDCRPEAELGALALEGPAGARAVPGITSFSIALGSDEGALVRELAVLVDRFEHDAGTGRASMNVVGFLEGADEAPLGMLFEAEVALLTWSDGDAVEALGYASTVASGRADTPLPLAP